MVRYGAQANGDPGSIVDGAASVVYSARGLPAFMSVTICVCVINDRMAIGPSTFPIVCGF
jgi:hypothetical protein